MIYVFLANGVEEIEALTPVDCLRRCKLDVKTVGIRGRTITGSHGITVLCDLIDEEAALNDSLEMIILPGGKLGTINLEKSQYVKSAIEYCHDNKIPIAAICAAPSILGHMGLLEGKKATCYVGFEDQLLGAKVLTDRPVVIDGDIITACGMGNALDFACAIISKLISSERAELLLTTLNKK